MTHKRFTLVVGSLVLLGMGLVSLSGAQEAAPGPKAPAEGTILIGMDFLPFLWLAIVAVVVSLLMYYLLRVKMVGGPAANILVGWVGAWLGSPVFGHWFKALSADGVYFIPAILGCASLVYACHCWHEITLEAMGRISQPGAAGSPSR
jgi:uncharacterized membrane protein YeaQ/YmgE (transglycosylase-associated protein family)